MDKFIKTGASDLHVTADELPYIRIHGSIEPLEGEGTITNEQLAKMSLAMVGEEKFADFKRDHELDMAVNFGETRLRLNLYRQQCKIAWALRALPSKFFPLDKLGLPLQICEQARTLQKGLVLVTGATGSGKSTTLASIINSINETRPCHIFTIEDPVEYRHFNKKAFISQREVGDDTVSFHEALRRVLREDPDVVLIGEMRDRITMQAALTLAETGHLTFATLHTSEAIQTVTRIIGSFPASEQEQIRTQLATTLNLIISQQLVPWDDNQGRSLAAEILVATPAVKAMIRENKIHQISSAMQTGTQLGMNTMNKALANLYAQGVIGKATAVQYSLDKEDLQRTLSVIR
ncbi:PilT/PilU family type 4a pilus ATPase [Lentisphaerota bacterium]|nr:PilT/PilU family type 4a pilus ATPase [Lentisphaerota bacterium]